MKKILLGWLFTVLAGVTACAQYNMLWIPDTLTGTTFNLTIRDTFQQIAPGNQTITGAINGSFWGPTMIWNKWDVVHPAVNNQLPDTTTIHWHGMHLPAIMDGGPHQTIPPYTTWSPYWQVVNNAGTYWYHPHLHMEAVKQLHAGIGGLIIVCDSAEAALSLPRKYGVDDIPLILTDRKFDASNQFVESPYGDSMLTNGVLRARYTIPAQVVRFRLLDAAIERSYNVGFSDNRVFHVITTDGGLLDTSVAVTRLTIHAGERYEILLNCTGQPGSSVDMMAYNSELPGTTPGGDLLPPGTPFENALDTVDFRILHLDIGTPTTTPVTAIPHNLAGNTFIDAATANLTRQVSISDSDATLLPGVTILGPFGFVLNHRLFRLNYVDYAIPLDNTEIWEIKSTSFLSHPFHIHDVEFNILSINGAAAPAYQQGWKDVMLVPAGQTVRFIAKFSDYADSLHPYMFHCHIALHEDEGMMGQFVVGNAPAGIMNKVQNTKMKLYPNPTASALNFEMEAGITIVRADIINTVGQNVKQFELNTGKATLDVSSVQKGLYFLRLTDTEGKTYIRSYLMQ